MAKMTLNTEGESSAHALIRAGHVDKDSAWSFSAEDGNKLLGPKGDDWAKYGRWHLGEDPSEPSDTKAHWKYPYGKDGKVYRRAVAAIRQRASQEGATTIFEAAGRLMNAMDDEDGKKESRMSGLRAAILGSRFGHLGAARSKPEDDEDGKKKPGDDDGKEARRAEEDEEEMKRKAAREKEEKDKEEMRRSRRARRARKGRQDGGDDDDDAGDDDEDEGDDDEMRRAATAGHDFALEAAFRAGARAQRRRCRHIFESEAAARNPVLAAELAFETPMTASRAVALLEKTAAPRSGSLLADRMLASGMSAVRVGPGPVEAPHGPKAIAASWDHAMKEFSPRN